MQLTQQGDCYAIRFRAMASPCELLVETESYNVACRLGKIARNEAQRIEKAFSRYREGNIVHAINQSEGKSVTVDSETAGLLDFAAQCFSMSDGLFDITSGVLGRAWHFDRSDKIPAEEEIKKLLPLVGWNKVRWHAPEFSMPQGMQIDFGGIGKEYAVDRVVNLLQSACDIPFLVNFGGDLHANKAPGNSRSWSVGVEAMRESGNAIQTIELQLGALTTSGDANRFLEKDGVRYGHILHPKTGWPVAHSPASITVAGNTCTEAGILSTLAMLHGNDAEQFLASQNIRYWCQR